jgi:hypothetical protein
MLQRTGRSLSASAHGKDFLCQRILCEYIEAEGFTVHDRVALEIEDNCEVGARDPMELVNIYPRVDIKGVDALVLSACVQMPSLEAIPVVEKKVGIPVLSAAVSTTFQMLQKMNLKTVAPNGGASKAGTPRAPPSLVLNARNGQKRSPTSSSLLAQSALACSGSRA